MRRGIEGGGGEGGGGDHDDVTNGPKTVEGEQQKKRLAVGRLKVAIYIFLLLSLGAAWAWPDLIMRGKGREGKGREEKRREGKGDTKPIIIFKQRTIMQKEEEEEGEEEGVFLRYPIEGEGG